MSVEATERPVGWLKELSEARGCSGDEGVVRGIILDAVKPYVDEYRVDTIGNLITIRKARTRAENAPKKVMVSGHMDEVGLMVTSIEGSGMLKFTSIGVIPQLLLSKKVLIGPKKVPGVVG